MEELEYRQCKGPKMHLLQTIRKQIKWFHPWMKCLQHVYIQEC